MENKIILKAQNKEELNNMIKRSITLNEDEAVKINVLKEPKKILFFEIKGTYEIEIVKKGSEQKNLSNNKLNENKNNRSFEKNNKKENNFERNDKKEKKAEKNNKKFNDKKDRKNGQNVQQQQSEKEKSVQLNAQIAQSSQSQTQNNAEIDMNIDRIRSFIKEFIVNSKLDITIVKIEKVDERYVVNVDGKDMRYLIGEKGSTLNSLEYLLTAVKTFKNIKVVVDSNNYKEKREESLRELARKKGKKVSETGRAIKLNPMSARERKIIHEEISFMKGLKTESVGEEPKRYLVIKKV